MGTATDPAEVPPGICEDSSAQTRVELQIGGMTCASCAARIEKKLNRMDGVTATVNYATEKAQVALAAGSGVQAADLITTVEKVGYTATVPPPPTAPAQAPERDKLTPLRERL